MGDAQSTPQVADVSHLTKEFVELNSPTKIHALMEMLKLCSYQEQLEFKENLMNYLHKDFITDLSTELSTKVISHLSMDDAVNCLSVSKNWYRIVSGCSVYWNRKAKILGLSKSFISSQLSQPSTSLHSLCIDAQRHHQYLKGLMATSFTVSRSLDDIECSYHYAGNGVALRYEEIGSRAQVTIEALNTPQLAVEIASFDVPPFKGRIKWASASSDYVLWKQADGTWCGCTTKGMLIPELDIWNDEQLPQGFHSISFCSKCHVVGKMSQAEDDCEVWDLQVIKLYKGSAGTNALRKMVYPIPLEGVKYLSTTKRYFLGGEVTLLPASLEVDNSGFCKSHSVMLQIDSSLAIHKLKMIDEMESSLVISQLLPNSLLSKPLKVFIPRQPDQSLSLMDFSGSKSKPHFCTSADLQRVAMIHDNYLYVWNLGSYEEENFVDLDHLDLPPDSKVIAVGSVYTVIASNSNGLCTVIFTSTGEVILQNTASTEKHHYELYAPLNQDWLDHFQYFDYLPLALMTDSKSVRYGELDVRNESNQSIEDKKELELKAIVGFRGQESPTLHPLTFV